MNNSNIGCKLGFNKYNMHHFRDNNGLSVVVFTFNPNTGWAETFGL